MFVAEYYKSHQEYVEKYNYLKNKIKDNTIFIDDRSVAEDFINNLNKFTYHTYIEFAITLLQNKKVGLPEDYSSFLYRIIVSRKKFHLHLPKLVFPNWGYMNKHNKESVNLLLLYLNPQKLTVNRIVHENSMREFGVNFVNLPQYARNMVFSQCLQNDYVDNKRLIQTFAKRHLILEKKMCNEFMLRILEKKTISNNYFLSFINNLDYFDKPIQAKIISRLFKFHNGRKYLHNKSIYSVSGL